MDRLPHKANTATADHNSINREDMEDRSRGTVRHQDSTSSSL